VEDRDVNPVITRSADSAGTRTGREWNHQPVQTGLPEKGQNVSTIYSPANETQQRSGMFVAAATACIVVILAVAAVAGFALGRHSISHVTPSAPSHAVTPANPVNPTPASSNVPSGALTAINSYETQNGPGVGKWVIASAQVSKVNPMYVFFRIGPAKGFEDSVQGGYGFALDSGNSWSVIGFGSALVGCPESGSDAAVVPPAVLTEFGFGCPSTAAA
jgi:hypothetical protein